MTETQVYFFRLTADENLSFGVIIQARYAIEDTLEKMGFKLFDVCGSSASYLATGDFEEFKEVVETVVRLHSASVVEIKKCKHTRRMLFY
jgi:hypothetical protein